MAATARWVRPTLGTTVAMLVAVAVLLGLGTWQLQRLQWKTGLLALIEARLSAEPAALPARIRDPESWEYRRVEVTGTFRHDLEMPLAARTLEGRLGYHVVTPLERPDASTVLVNRGWVPVDRLDPATRAAGQPAGTVSVQGIARVPRPQAWMEPDNEPSANTWFRIDAQAMAAHIGEPVAPVVVEAGEAENPGGLPVGGVTRVAIPNNHLQYVVTWYSLAAVLIAIYVTYHWRRPDAPR